MTAMGSAIAPRKNGVPPPQVPLADIDLGDRDFWALDDDVRDGAFATLRREAPISFFEVAEVVTGVPGGRGHWALTGYDEVVSEGTLKGLLVDGETVPSAREGDSVEVTVDDNGPGMPPKARENLFAAFRGSARAGGIGLGLAIARELIEAHGGEIDLAGKESRGTRFVFVIPDRPASS